MKKRTIFLIALVIFFPLNSLPTYASDAANNMAANLPASSLFDLDNTQSPEKSVVKDYVDCFSVVSEDAMKYALSGYAELNNEGKITKKDIITIVDFSKPSTEERMFVINLKTKQKSLKSALKKVKPWTLFSMRPLQHVVRHLEEFWECVTTMFS